MRVFGLYCGEWRGFGRIAGVCGIFTNIRENITYEAETRVNKMYHLSISLFLCCQWNLRRMTALCADRGQSVVKSTRLRATAGSSPSSPRSKPTCITEVVPECQEIALRMNRHPRGAPQPFFQCIHGRNHFSIYFRSFPSYICISIWSQRPVMQRSQWSGELAA